MKVALVYDRINKFGGAEQVLLALHEIWPDAPIYTAVYDKQRASWARVFKVHTSFLQYIPGAKRHHELFPWLTPLGFELFNFDMFDVVISITSAEAKTIITKPNTVHICYCLTPTRYLWSGYSSYKKEPGLGIFSWISKIALSLSHKTLKKWDLYAAQKPDYYIAISNLVSQRIVSFYNRNVDEVIYPPVRMSEFSIANNINTDHAPFLVVSRLVSYKRIDIVIDACTILNVPLVVIGDGKDAQRLINRAGKNVRFIRNKLTTEELARYYQQCKAFLFAGEEDFGIVAAEAQASGKPVLCYKKSGIAEIIIPGKTGEVFEEQTVKCLVNALSRFHLELYDPVACRKQASQFDIVRFKQQISKFVDKVLKEHNSKHI